MTPARLRLVLLLLVPVALGLALATGSVAIAPATLWGVFTGSEHGIPATLVLDLRLPRAVTAFTVGGLLALSGSLLQVLLRNPLADPYILGVSGGAAVGALASLLLGLGSVWVSGNAMLGSLMAMLLVFGLSHGRGVWTETRLLLTGVVVATGCGAFVSLMLALSPQTQISALLFWLLGDLGQSGMPKWWGPGVLAAGLALTLPFARALNLYTRGELVAASLGENVAGLRYGIYFLASILTATAVTLAGAIGFLGLVVPHLLRLLGSRDHRRLLVDAVLAGGSLLVMADTLARTVAAPAQLPVGVLTALLGVPLFLYLLAHGSRQPP
jgi:iron complex transport system permease protein